jgi:hypothetical protein
MEQLTPAQCGYLVRKAIISKTDSQFASSDIGHFLYQMANGLSIDTNAIEQEQLEKVEARTKNTDARIDELNKRIKKFEG